MRHTFSDFSNLPFNPANLLDRQAAAFDSVAISETLQSRTILITGAAGSIGRELALQVCRCAPGNLILIDQAESALYELDLIVRQQYSDIRLQIFPADITDHNRMTQVFAQNQIDLILHAAAYKHVPLMEQHPYEAIKTNIIGTQILAQLSLVYKVRQFVFVSTDKAVNPVNVMGATKRFAEMYLQYLATCMPDQTQFLVTRFGNVLGSSGSFIFNFDRQIRAGGPVTVTHPLVERYFMSLTEACQLVLKGAASCANHGILFFNMGEAYRIADIARRMIQLYGFCPDEDIEITFTGLRPGEKLQEDPMQHDSSNYRQIHPHITYSDFPDLHSKNIKAMLSAIRAAMESGQPERMLAALKMAVPEYGLTTSLAEIH